MSYQQQISVSTKGHGDMHDLTEKVIAVVNASGIQTGIVHVFNVGSTAALGAIEVAWHILALNTEKAHNLIRCQREIGFMAKIARDIKTDGDS